MSSLILCEAHAADPRLSHLMPPGGERGTEVEVTFRGQRSGQEPQGILFYEPGIECSHIEAVDENAALAKLKISADCRVGIHAFRLRTASGVSSLRTFLVGTMPVVQEVEPNNDFNSLQAISLDTTVHGVVTNEDVDYFVVEAKKGERLTVEIEGMRLGIPQAQSFFDPFVAILDEKRFELASCDDSPLLQQDGVCSILAPADGKYIVQVRETAYRGNASCRYRLHVGRFPRPLAVYPAGGQPGETLHVQWLGELSGDRREEVVLPAEERPDFALLSQEEARFAPSGSPFRVVDLQNVLETEPNNSIEEFNTFSAPAALNGIIAEAGGIDYFRFPATKGQVFDIRVFARGIGSPLDPVLHVFDAKGKSLAGNDDNGGKPDSYLRFTVPADGEYLVRIFDHLKGGGPTYTYRIELTHPKPHVELQLQERERLIATTIAVPQGNRTAVMLQATRRDFGGELTLSCEGFPAGVTADTIPILADQNLVPVVFSATSEAALAGALVAPRASPTKEGATLESHFKQRTWLLRGRNDVEVWSHYADRAAVVVTKKVPFSIDLVEPKVPLVRGGSMQLRVVAQREEGFDEPILVRMLYNPHGVSSSRSISIAKGETEVVIPLTSAANSQVRHWDIVVTGQANVAGQVLVSTPLTKLEVAEPYVELKFPKVAGEQGESLEILVEVHQKKPFDGTAKVVMHGLPAGATTKPQELTAETKQLVFPIELAANARVGQHKRVFCQIEVTEHGEPILHTLGYGELRVDKPLEEPPLKNHNDTTAQR